VQADLILANLLSPPILFFFLGAMATLVRSDLEIPQPLPKFFSLYLLLAIGFKGGVELAHGSLTRDVVVALVAAMVMAAAVPVWTFFVLRRRLPVADAAAIAATYGSISAVTFITAAAFLQSLGIPYGGHLVAAMALMESPAIVIGVLFYRLSGAGSARIDWKELSRDAFLNGSVFLIMGSLVIGAVTGERGAEALAPFTNEIFKGMLCFFLLDMGLVAARRVHDLRRAGWFLGGFAVVVPMVNAVIAIGVARLSGMGVGDALMFTVLCASASYIAVPAAMRLAVPEANPSIYVSMSLGITFPFNIIAGIPAYLAIIESLWS
jgi:uncharacterized protein